MTDCTTQYDNPLLAALPRIGSPQGKSPSTINDRIMECLGSTFWPEPLLPTDAAINAAKGRLIGFEAATGVDNIITLAKVAVLADTPAAADVLLQAIRVGFAVFDYINSPDASSKWNLVRHQVYVQFGYIENVYGVSGLQQSWLLFSADYFVGFKSVRKDGPMMRLRRRFQNICLLKKPAMFWPHKPVWRTH
jgi:chitinase